MLYSEPVDKAYRSMCRLRNSGVDHRASQRILRTITPMATESLVLSTLAIRLQQSSVLLEWLVEKRPADDSLRGALESLRQVELTVTNTVAVESN